jgi:hypothetical protein
VYTGTATAVSSDTIATTAISSSRLNPPELLDKRGNALLISIPCHPHPDTLHAGGNRILLNLKGPELRHNSGYFVHVIKYIGAAHDFLNLHQRREVRLRRRLAAAFDTGEATGDSLRQSTKPVHRNVKYG